MRRSRIESLWSGLPLLTRDGIIALLLFGVSLIPLGVRGLEMGELQQSAPDWVGPPLAALITLPLALRRFMPAIALALSGLGFAADQLVGVDLGLAGLALLLAIYSVAAFGRRHRVWVGAAAGIAYSALAIALSRAGSPETTLDWFTFAAVLAVPWILGELVRRRRAQDDQRQRLAVEAALRRSGFVLVPNASEIVINVASFPLTADAPLTTTPGIPSPSVDTLTARELEVLRRLARGLSNSEIAAEMFVTRETVKTYVSRLLSKLGLRDRTQAAVFAHRSGIAE